MNQLKDIKRRGPQVILPKAWKVFGMILAAVPLVLVRLLSPVVCIRFGELSSNRIARYVGEPETYLSEIDMDLHKGRYIDIFFNQAYISNQQVKKMWSRTIRVWQIVQPLAKLNNMIPGGNIHRVPWRLDQEMDIHGVLSFTKPHLIFNREEELSCIYSLQQMGIEKDSRFICFHARDSAYEIALGSDSQEERISPSNADIQSFVPGVEEITKAGIFAVRMGANVEKSLICDNPRVIDYPNKFRTELLDLYLGSKCEFFVCTTDGINLIPMVFRRPTVRTNFASINKLAEWYVAWPSSDLWLPKKIWITEEGRYMTFTEIFQSKDGIFKGRWWDKDSGLEVVDNTPDEITAVILEMESRLNGTWISTQEDDDLQNRFRSLCDESDPRLVSRSRIGADFLKKNSNLLE